MSVPATNNSKETSRKQKKRKQEENKDQQSFSNNNTKKSKKNTPKAPSSDKLQNLTPLERQYLYSAGLHPTRLFREEKKRQKQETSSTKDACTDFATRALGSTSQTTRHEAIRRLQKYLSYRAADQGLSYLDLLKLWKGMWHGLYMCDKVVVQEELSSHMARLLWCVAGTIENDMEEGERYMQLEIEDFALQEGEEDSDEYDVEMEVLHGVDISEQEDEEEGDEEELHSGGDKDDKEVSDDDVHSGEDEDENHEDHQCRDVHCHRHHHNDDDEEEVEEEEDDENTRHHTSVHLVCLFIKAYFETIHREWGNMDKHRLDKFYRSMRQIMNEIFQYCQTRQWHCGIIHMLNDCIFNEILCQEQTGQTETGAKPTLRYANGVRFHLMDIMLQELASVSISDDELRPPITTVQFLDLLEPYLSIVISDSEKVVQARVMERVLEKFLLQYSSVRERQTHNDDEDTQEEEEPALNRVNVRTVAQHIFDMASNPETSDRYRKSLYEMHKMYMRRVKEMQIDAEIEERDDDQDDEVEIDDEMKDEIVKEEEEEANVPISEPVASTKDIKINRKKKKKERKSSKNQERSEQQVEDQGDSKKEVSESKPKPQDPKPTSDNSRTDRKDTSSEPNSGNSKNNKKKKNKKRRRENSDISGQQQEEEIIISMREQSDYLIDAVKSIMGKKRAAAKIDLVAKSDRKQKTEDEIKEEKERQRRVKFGTMNRSKSYKASMTALKTMEHPATASREPEKPILREPKYVPQLAKASKKKKVARKKASDWFRCL